MNFLKDVWEDLTGKVGGRKPLLRITIVTAVLLTVFFLFAKPANAQEGVNRFTFNVKEEGADLNIYLNDEYTKLRIPGIKQYSKAQQEKILDQLSGSLQFCASKGNWAHDVAYRAGLDPRPTTVQSEINKMLATWTEAKRATLVDAERVIRTAFKHGYEDPYEFARKNVIWCMTENF